MGNINYVPPARELTDGLCPACGGADVGFDVVSYLSGVSAPDGYCESLTEERSTCYDCGETFTLAVRSGVNFSPEEFMDSVNRLCKGPSASLRDSEGVQ